MQRTLGGNRLGSGKKMKIGMHEYNRTTVNLSKRWSSSMAPGVLYPAYVNIGLRGDTFDIDIDAIGRTIPTKGPLFGNFKLQIDCFAAPFRLYHALLHNNPIDLGMKMKEVKFPMINMKVTPDMEADERNGKSMIQKNKMANNSLMKYLGLSGIGIPAVGTTTKRKINAIPLLAYYDIFKNYYANKQEEKAFVIGNTSEGTLIKAMFITIFGQDQTFEEQIKEAINNPGGLSNTNWIYATDNGQRIDTNRVKGANLSYRIRKGEIAAQRIMIIQIQNSSENIYINGQNANNNPQLIGDILNGYEEKYQIIALNSGETTENENYNSPDYKIENIKTGGAVETEINSFNLKDIDKAREDILSRTHLGESLIINEPEFAEGNFIYANADTLSKSNLGGLALKTYQSDIFNAWIKEDTISGPGGIADITRVSTAGNSFTIDALILAKKVYDMLNRIAIAGGTYQDWQDAVYTENARHVAETPIYYGGMSTDIEFEEVVQTSQTENSEPLGTLGGRGTLYKKKGGKITIKCDEACVIMIIASITPRVNYTQGNKWYLTELESMDDLHKPALDGIGFEDLLSERLAWWSANINSQGHAFRQIIGKQPAWSNYRTDINEAFGDFADDANKAYMILQRDYKPKWEEARYYIEDATTYIDPSKYNYAFAYNEIDAQNFWVQIYYNIKCRRLMSAREIPNL